MGRRPFEAEFIRRAPRQASASANAGCPFGRRRPTVGRRPPRPNSFGAPRARHRPPPTQRALFRSAQADRRPKAPQGRIHSARPAPGIGPRRHKERFSGRRRPTVGRRPPKAEFIRHTPRQASASADTKNALPVGAGRPSAEGPPRPNSFGAHADRRPKAFTPIEIGLPRRSRARRRPPPTQRTLFRSAQADRRPKAPRGRIHSAHMPTAGRRPSRRLKSASSGAGALGVGLRRRKRRTFGRRRPTVGRRPPKAEFIRRAGRPSAEGLPRPNSSGAFRRPPNQAPHGAAL
jgi:hypothetical protein